MAEFLSDAWLAALDESARALDVPSGVAPFVVEQVVTDVRGRGEVRYQVVFAAEGVRIRRETDELADVSFATDAETAAGIARGETNAQHALAAGRFRVAGNVGTLVSHRMR